MADTSITKSGDENNVQDSEETRSRERYIKPAVDIIETDNGLVLAADIPGATKESLDINIEKGILTVNAPASDIMQGQPIYTEFELADYYRQFSISETLDHENVTAGFLNGILTLKIPVSKATKPHKIEIKAG